MISDYWNKIKHNHFLMMVLCCGIPILLLYVVIYFFGIKSWITLILIVLLCPLIHLFMMRDMHKTHSKSSKGE